jgi:hypothetical protein
MSGRGCTLHSAPRVRWDVSARELLQLPSTGAIRAGLYRGRLPDPALAGQRILGFPIMPDEPFEDPTDGCPGGWYRSPYADSVARYRRRRVENGARVPNPLFDRAAWQIQAAAMWYEHEQERFSAYRSRVDADRFERTRK